MRYCESKVTAGDSTVDQTTSCRGMTFRDPQNVSKSTVIPQVNFIYDQQTRRELLLYNISTYVLTLILLSPFFLTTSRHDREKTGISMQGYPHQFIKSLHTIIFCGVM